MRTALKPMLCSSLNVGGFACCIPILMPTIGVGMLFAQNCPSLILTNAVAICANNSKITNKVNRMYEKGWLFR